MPEAPSLNVPARMSSSDEQHLRRFESAARAGDSNAMFRVAHLLSIYEDWAGARAWYTYAASAGNVEAMATLGVLAKKDGDLAAAREWWEKGAAAGGDRARMLLSDLN